MTDSLHVVLMFLFLSALPSYCAMLEKAWTPCCAQVCAKLNNLYARVEDFA